jgi:zinc protease
MNLFGGGPTNRSSRLYRALVDTRHASAVACGMAATLDPYLFTVSATVRAGEDADRVETVMLDEIARLRDGGITSDELARAKKQARAQFAYSAESVTSQGFWLGFAEVLVGQDWLDRHLDHIDAVTREDVSRVAGKYLTDHRRTVGRYRPRAEAA